MNIQLRAWQPEDAPALARNADSPQVAAWLRDTFPHPYTLEDARFFISLCEKADAEKELLLAITVDGTLAGGISLTRGEDIHRRGAELGYWLGKAWWGRGISTGAVGVLLARHLPGWGLLRLQAEVFAGNPASARVLEKNGFRYEGRLRSSVYKNSKVWDSLLYALVWDTEEQPSL